MHRRTLFLAMGLMLSAALLPRHRANAQTSFVPNEVLVSEDTSPIIDPEFAPRDNRFTWIDARGNVWVGKADPETGDFDPASGKSERVDIDAVTVAILGNGSEWVASNVGPQVIYTKYDAEGKRALARALKLGDKWLASYMENGTDRYGPIGSADVNDPNPRISYIGDLSTGERVIYWRYLNTPESEEIVPNAQPPGGRWVLDTQLLAFSGTGDNGQREAFLYDVETKVLEQVSRDGGPKSATFGFFAPEFNDELVVFTLDSEVNLGVYRKLDGAWTRIYTAKPPSENNYLWSPEPFVYEGQSYIVTVVSPSDNQKSLVVPTEIWLVGINPDAPFYRRISDDNIRVRKDPEVFMSRNGPYVYVTNTGEAGASKTYRLATGLGSAV